MLLHINGTNQRLVEKLAYFPLGSKDGNNISRLVSHLILYIGITKTRDYNYDASQAATSQTHTQIGGNQYQLHFSVPAHRTL